MTVEDAVGESEIAPLSTSSSPEELDNAMFVARAAAESQKEIEEAGGDILAPADDGDQDEDLADDDDEAAGPEQPSQDRSEPVAIPQPTAQDHNLVRQVIAACGSEQEYAALKSKAASGTATAAERERLQNQTAWREIAGPLYRTFVAEGARLAQTKRGTSSTKPAARPGSATTGSAKARSSAPAKKPAAAAKPAKLKLPKMLNADGTLNPEFEKLAHAGKLYGLEKLTED